MSKFKSSYIITMQDIVREGDPILKRKLPDVTLPLQEEDREALLSMMLFLKNSQDPEMAEKYNLRGGVGLSANQIGLDKRMFVTYFQDEKGKDQEHFIINPRIVSHSVAMIYLPQGEGCLSVDRDVEGFVPRYEKIKIKAFDLNGEPIQLTFRGYSSIVMQHEIDHLDGIMFYDRFDPTHPYRVTEQMKPLEWE